MPKPIIKSPEFQLLLSCAKVKAGDRELAIRGDAIAKGIDWSFFLSLVDRHLVHPIVHYNLHADERIPDFVRQSLKKAFVFNQLQVLNAQRFQIRLQQFWEEKRIKGVFLKGISLSQLYYGDIALRHFSDIDCWVEMSRLSEVVEWLEKLGYEKDRIWNGLTTRQKSHLFEVDYHIHMRASNINLPAMVEVHWSLQDRQGNFNLEPESQSVSFLPLETGIVSLPVLNHMDNFIYLCAHGCRHGWYRLKWLFDLPQLLEQIEMDWFELIRRAEILDAKEQVIQSMQLMHTLLLVNLPQQVLLEIQRHRNGFVLNYFMNQLSFQGNYSVSLQEKVARFFFLVRQNRRTLWRKKFWMKNLTSPTDWKILPLPDSLFHLYFALRPFLWLFRQLSQRKYNV